MKQLCLEHEIPFAVATYPFLATPNPYTEIDNWVLAYCKAHKIPTINLREAYPPEEDLSNYWTNIFDPHPNRASIYWWPITWPNNSIKISSNRQLTSSQTSVMGQVAQKGPLGRIHTTRQK